MYAHVLNRCEFSYMSFLEYALRRVAVSILEERCFFFFFLFQETGIGKCVSKYSDTFKAVLIMLSFGHKDFDNGWKK